MNPGELRERIQVLQTSTANDCTEWLTAKTTWASSEITGKTNLFSRIGIGAATAVFTIRRQPLTLHNAIRWRSEHYFITEIKPLGTRYYQVTAAKIEPKICIAEHLTEEMGEYNQPVTTGKKEIVFPSCVVEKYMGYSRENAYDENEFAYVLVTPKEISLQSGQIVTVATERYHITICHTLDDYKNEYEIMRTEDV